MYREKDGKYYSVTGTKGYRWLEAEVAKTLGKEGDIDPKYHDDLANEAIEAINQYGDYDRFVDTSRPYIFEKKERELLVPCGDGKYNTCLECPNCSGDICKRGYSLTSYIEHGGDSVIGKDRIY